MMNLKLLLKGYYSIKYQIFLQVRESMATIKFFHVLFVFIWVGNLLALTRLLGYHVKQDIQTQKNMVLVYQRMYRFISLPSMAMTIVFGSVLIMNIDPDKGLFWFAHKLAFAMGVIVCDFICGFYISDLVGKADTSRGVKYKILHGVCGLCLIGVLVSIYILKPA